MGGFFLDLNLTLPTSAWTRLREQTALDHPPLPANWWGLEDPELVQALEQPLYDAAPFTDVFDTFTDGTECIAQVDADDDDARTHVRFCTVFADSVLSITKPFARVFEAARRVGGQGLIRLVNDTTAPGEAGVLIVIGEDGELCRERIGDPSSLVRRFGREIWGDEFEADTP